MSKNEIWQLEMVEKQVLTNKFIRMAKTLMICSNCKQKYTKRNICQCLNGHSVCYDCATNGTEWCAYCLESFHISRCVILYNFVELLTEAEKTETLDQLEELLQCSVCYERLLPDVRLCTLGHPVCLACCTKVTVCPLCQSNFTHFTNKLVIEIVKQFPYRCLYYQNGCQELGNFMQIRNHEMNCQLRDMYCHIEHCFWKGGSRETLIKHIENKHAKNIRQCKHVKIPIDLSKLRPHQTLTVTNFINYNDKYFWQHFYFTQGRVRFITLMLGSPKDAKVYKVSVSGNHRTEIFDVFSESYVNLLGHQSIRSLDISKYVTQTLSVHDSGKDVLMNTCSISIIKEQTRWVEWLSITIFGGILLFLFKKLR